MPFSWLNIIAFVSVSLILGLLIWCIFSWRFLALKKQAEELLKRSLEDLELEIKTKESNLLKGIEAEKEESYLKIKNQKYELDQKERQLRLAQAEVEMEKAYIGDKELELSRMEAEAGKRQAYLESLRQMYRTRLTQIAHISESEALSLLKLDLAKDCESELKKIRQELLMKPLISVENEAKRILVDTMQRITMAPTSNTNSAVIKIPNEEVKGRLIGKEGRNIRSFESVTGTELLIAESPGFVSVSSFDPVRREVAHIALKELIRDGRIHPASIEEVVQNRKNQIDQKIIEEADKALEMLGIVDVHPEIVVILGQLYFRLSNNQNTLEHSIEVAYLCSMIASELKVDPHIAKRCGLFHDLGKAMNCEIENSHAMAAANLLRKYGEDIRVVNAVAASHNEVVSESIYGEILKLADAISASRPGARADSMDGYLQRIQDLEKIALAFPGVMDAYGIKAGREVRVIVSPEVYQDDAALLLAGRIRSQIEEKLDFPGKIKVTVIREQRFIETAQ